MCSQEIRNSYSFGVNSLAEMYVKKTIETYIGKVENKFKEEALETKIAPKFPRNNVSLN